MLADRTLVQHLCARARTDGRRPAFRAKAMGIWHEVTWAEHRDAIEHLALGLQELGVGRGDRVALLAPNGPPWLSVDLAAQSLGAAAVGFYPTTTDAELAGLLEATRPKVFFAGALVDVERLGACGHAGVDVVVVLEPAAVSHAGGRAVVTFAELLARGAATSANDGGAWERAVADTSPDDVAAVFPTLGTTGAPKVVELSSRDLVLGATGCLERIGPPGPRDRTVVRLPLAHVAERQLSVYASVLYGCVTHLPEDDVAVGEATLEAQPTIVTGLPADWTAAAGRVDAGIAESGRLARTVWRAAMSLRRRQQQAQWQGRRASAHVRVGAWLGYWAVCRPVLGKFGYAQLRCAITVNEPLPVATAERWGRWGVRLHEAYTLVEGGGFVAVQERPGASLTLVAGSEATLADDGELLVRRTTRSGGPDGHLPGADRGWLRTGDLAHIAGDGDLRVLGRRDDVITLDAGPVMPTEVEERLRQSPFVSHAVVCEIGEGRIGALLAVDSRALGGWARQQGLGLTGYAALVGADEVQALLAAEVTAANRGLAADGLPEVSAHRLLPHPLDADGGEELTALHTVRRASVVRQAAALVEDMAGPVHSAGRCAMSWSVLPSVIVDSLVLASIYALVALGWVFIFRATGILNFAVGQFILLGCYLFFWVAFSLGLPFLVALPIALVLIALLGVSAYLGTLKPLAGQPLFSPIMVTLGLSIVMTSAMVIIWGGTARLMPPPVAVTSYDLPLDASITNIGIATIVTALVVYAAIMTFLRKSKRGVQMRATAENPLLASQRGINIDVIFMLAFAVAVGASTLAGLSFAYTTAGLAPTIVALGLRGLAPALIGGMDSIGGALIGSVIVAFIETVAVTQFGGDVKDMIAFLVLLVALAFRPYGLFGTPEIRRV